MPLVILVICVPILSLAALLEPDPTGLGTHRQLGLPSCGLYNAVGVPCMTCGYTKAFCHAAHGNLARAFAIQPAAAALAVVSAALSIVAVYGLMMGVSLAPLARWLWRAPLWWAVGSAVLGAWIYKILAVGGLL